MVTLSAAAIQYAIDDDGAVSVFIAHMGGPFWAKKDSAGWSFPKGEYNPEDEDGQSAAAREFEEEIGVPIAVDDLAPLGEFKQASGKVIVAFCAGVAPPLTRFVRSNEFEMEWPRGSGVMKSFPEVDRAEWFTIHDARDKLVKGQRPILDAILLRAKEGRPHAYEGHEATAVRDDAQQGSLFD